MQTETRVADPRKTTQELLCVEGETQSRHQAGSQLIAK